jgi:hypothetical protein
VLRHPSRQHDQECAETRMGLDIYHFHVKDEVTDDPIIIDVSQPQLRNIIHFSRKKTNQYFEHARLLS